MSTIAFRSQGKSNGDICNNYPTIFEHGFVGWGEQDGIYKWAPYLVLRTLGHHQWRHR